MCDRSSSKSIWNEHKAALFETKLLSWSLLTKDSKWELLNNALYHNDLESIKAISFLIGCKGVI